MDFNPDTPPTNQEEFERYVNWCRECLVVTVNDDTTPRTYLSAQFAAGKLLVTSTASLLLHPDDAAYQRNLDKARVRARSVERGHADTTMRDVLVARSVTDCFRATTEWAQTVIDATKCGWAALTLINSTILHEPWDLDAPDVWALILAGAVALSNAREGLTHEDLWVRVDTSVVDKMSVQNLDRLSRLVGAPPPSMN